MPGMMNTILNLGLNDETVEGLARKTDNPRFAYDCYRRFIQMFGEVALDIDMEKFDHIFDERKKKAKAKLDTDLTADDLKAIIADYKKLVQKETGKPFPQDARQQLGMSRDAVFNSWWNPKAAYYRRMEKIPDEIGTAANVQTMVFGNMGENSGTGVGFTRDPATGEKVFYGEYPDQRAGRRRRRRHPHARADRRSRKADARSLQATARDHHQARTALPRHAGLRVHHRRRQALHAADPQRQAHRHGRGSRRCGMVEEGMISEKEAVLRVAPSQLDQLLHPLLDPHLRQEPDQNRHRHLGIARRRRRTRRLHRRRRRRAVQERSGDPGPQRDHARRHPRHGRRQGHS